MDFAQRTIDLARQNVIEGGRPFATVIAKGGESSPKAPTRSRKPATRQHMRRSSPSARRA